jgi:drug/metabolite transporter (DMT)-like permease
MLAVTSSASMPRVDPRTPLALSAIYIIWGTTYLAIRIAVVDLPPLLTASMRFVAAGLVMLLIALRRGVAIPPLRDWLRVAPVAVLLFIGGNGFVSLAEMSVSSGGAAVVCAMMPLWMGVLGAISGEKPSRREWFSLVLGFAGVVVLLGGPSLAGEPWHVALLMFSPIAWALGSQIARRLPGRQDVFMMPAMQMLIGGTLLAILGAARGETLPVDASASSWLAVAYLAVMGSLVGFTAYNWLLRNTRPVVATSYAYVNPIIAVLAGALLYGEPLGVTTLLANVMIVAAVFIALRKPKAAPAGAK